MTRIALLAAIIAATGWTVTPPTVTPPPTRPDVLDAPFNGFAFCIGCFTCMSGGHSTETAPLSNYAGTGHDGQCLSGSCLVHGVCGGLAQMGLEPPVPAVRLQDYAALRHALRSQSTEELVAVLKSMDSRLQVSKSRQAVQVLGCNGTVVAHFPISTDQLQGVIQQSVGVVVD